MASSNDNPSTMKFEKSHYDVIRKSIFEVSQNLGSGATSAVPYDTSWVARIPKTGDLSRPAFPECLQWLRDHQREDSTWGGAHPHTLHSNILNTLAGVLAFSQWNYPEDEEKKNKAIEALTTLAKTLPEIETREHFFEMIMSGLLDDAREFGLVIPYERFDWCSKTGKKELQKLEHELMSNRPNKSWDLLEAASRTLDLEFESFRPEITRYGLIASQPSTTAYVLRFARLRGVNFPEAEWTLKNLCIQNEGGVPHFGQCDNFEIIFGLNFLLKADINPRINVKYSVTENALNTLKGRLNSIDGIGFCANWRISDSECLLTALRVVHQTSNNNNGHGGGGGKKTDYETAPTKKPKISIETEPLKNQHDLLNENEVSEHTTALINNDSFKELSSVDKSFLAGKRNVSMYYNILESVSNSTYENKKATDILQLIGGSQNDDGGWGDRGTSTVEETAYVCLAIFRLVQTNKGVMECINFSKLADFINNVSFRSESECFWCYKVNFCSPIVAKAAITAAKYAIFQIQRLCAMTDALNEHQERHIFSTEPWDVNNELINPGHILLVGPQVPRHKIEVDEQEVMHIFNNIFQSKQDDYQRALINTCLEMSYIGYPDKLSPQDRVIDTFLPAFFFAIDYVFDVFLSNKNTFLTEADTLFSVLKKILRGDYADLNQVPEMSFPKFSLLAQWAFCLRKVMEKKGWKVDDFIEYLDKNMFNGFFLAYKLQCYGIDPTPKRYLQVHRLDIGFPEIIYNRCILAGKTEGMTEFEQSESFVKYFSCANKVGRLNADISTIAKDVRLSRSDNYCLKLCDEYKISLQTATVKATKKRNKEVVKMLCMKKQILEDPMFINNQTLAFILKHVDYGLDCGLLWCMSSPRYHSQTNFTISNDIRDQKLDLLSVRGLCFDEIE